jgi:hypothetical protein
MNYIHFITERNSPIYLSQWTNRQNIADRRCKQLLRWPSLFTLDGSAFGGEKPLQVNNWKNKRLQSSALFRFLTSLHQNFPQEHGCSINSTHLSWGVWNADGPEQIGGYGKRSNKDLVGDWSFSSSSIPAVATIPQFLSLDHCNLSATVSWSGLRVFRSFRVWSCSFRDLGNHPRLTSTTTVKQSMTRVKVCPCWHKIWHRYFTRTRDPTPCLIFSHNAGRHNPKLGNGMVLTSGNL